LGNLFVIERIVERKRNLFSRKGEETYPEVLQAAPGMEGWFRGLLGKRGIGLLFGGNFERERKLCAKKGGRLRVVKLEERDS